MNSKEIVKKTIHFEKPERLPYEVWVDLARFEEEQGKESVDYIIELFKKAPRDFIGLDINADPSWRPGDKDTIRWSMGGYYHDEKMDEWQVTWKELRVVDHPLEKSWELAREYKAPDPYAPGRFDHAKEIMSKNKDKYIIGYVWFTLFERLWMLRGFNNMLTDPYTDYDDFCILRDKIMDFNLGLIKQWLELGVDGIFISDDWGGQEKLLVNPDYWIKFYEPSYKKMFDLIHSGGADAWYHCCGNATELIPYLIDLKLDVLNPIQPQAMDIGQIGKEYSGKMCFFGGVDIQETLPHGKPGDVRKEVEYLIRTLGSKNGGYIGGTSHTILPDTPLENIKALFEAFDKYCASPVFRVK